MTSNKKENMFRGLAALQTKHEADSATAPATQPPLDDTPPSPAPVEARPKTPSAKKKPEPAKGKRDNPDYCQANAYVPKAMRKAVEKELLDVDGLDFSTLVENLLAKWLKSRRVSE